MRVALIAAVDLAGLIGAGGRLPWRVPADLQRFRALTVGKPVIMGRKTFESIGRPLAKRPNIVLSRSAPLALPGCETAVSLDDALRLAERHGGEEALVIGGAALFAEALPRARRMYITVIEGRFAGDTWFPRIDADDWALTSRESHAADETNLWPYHFLVLEPAQDRGASRGNRVLDWSHSIRGQIL